MADMAHGYNGRNIGTIGTVVLSDIPTHIQRVVIPGTYVGTVNFHDAATAAGTTATSQIISFGLPGASTLQQVTLEINCKNGLVYQATGTPSVLVIWG